MFSDVSPWTVLGSSMSWGKCYKYEFSVPISSAGIWLRCGLEINGFSKLPSYPPLFHWIQVGPSLLPYQFLVILSTFVLFTNWINKPFLFISTPFIKSSQRQDHTRTFQLTIRFPMVDILPSYPFGVLHCLIGNPPIRILSSLYFSVLSQMKSWNMSNAWLTPRTLYLPFPSTCRLVKLSEHLF